ncbi:hypothetical protein [Dysgonomonas sp. 520]|uniref:hypothetical protein n=1 Tax=Dysgonomonas sp. 520 TaxID=2302931 RepID=UPI0013D0BE8D|nr:hypothetical protein [Dysgonomonas sp. 520]NDW08112.1 hypothetical protein [Dysgonomonas sp. 520]
MDQTWFNEYKVIKEKFDFSYKGYNIKNLIVGYLNFDYNATPIVRDVFKEFYNSCSFVDLPKAFDTKQNVLITYLIDRTDYRSLALTAQQYYPDSEVVNLSALPLKKISPFGWTFIKHFWFAVWMIYRRGIGKGVMSKLNFIALLIRILNQIKTMERAPVPQQIKRYVSFNSSYKEESLLTMYFNKHNVETITLQHGIFCDFKLMIPFDVINYENCIAQKMLCWGQSTVDFLTQHGFDASRLIVIGNLKYKDFKITSINQNFKKCLVLLGRQLYIGTNDKLLEVLKQYNKKHNNGIVFYIKKHPFVEDSFHAQYADVSSDMIFLGREHSVQEILKSDLVDFSISVNTTAYYESLALGKPCLRWTEEENEEFVGLDDKFENLEQLEDRIEKLRNISQDEILTEVKDVIRYIFNPNL